MSLYAPKTISFPAPAHTIGARYSICEKSWRLLNLLKERIFTFPKADRPATVKWDPPPPLNLIKMGLGFGTNLTQAQWRPSGHQSQIYIYASLRIGHYCSAWQGAGAKSPVYFIFIFLPDILCLFLARRGGGDILGFPFDITPPVAQQASICRRLK